MTSLLLLLAALASGPAELVTGTASAVEHLRDADALTRATAARVVMSRGVNAAVPGLRAALEAERDHAAAREQVRAIVMLGNDEDVAFAASQLVRYPDSIDATFADAVARLDGTRPFDLYFKHVRQMRHVPQFFHVALWGRGELADAVGARLIGAKDARGWGEFLNALHKADRTLSAAIAGVAAGSDDDAIRTAMLWHLVNAGKTIDLNPREGVALDEAFARELLRRLAGEKPVETREWTAWLGTKEGRTRLREESESRLTRTELKAWRGPGRPPSFVKGEANVPQPQFLLPVALPAGLTTAVLSAAGCGTDAWLGSYAARVDMMGRVAALELGSIETSARCRTALDGLLRLTLARPQRIDAKRIAADLVAVRSMKEQPCFDAGPLFNATTGEAVIESPKVTTRAEPHMPGSVRTAMRGTAEFVAIEAVISETGCVRNVRVTRSSRYPELNRETILALMKWKFRPGTFNGVPADVDFNLTVSFRNN